MSWPLGQCNTTGALTKSVASSPGRIHAPAIRTRVWNPCVRAQAQMQIAIRVNASTMANEKLAAKLNARHTEHAAHAFHRGQARAWLYAAMASAAIRNPSASA